MCSVRLLDYNCFIERKIERKKAECMHVCAGTNKDGVCLDRNTTPPPQFLDGTCRKANKYRNNCQTKTERAKK